MSYAVLLYKFTENLDGVPEDWPAEVYKLEETSVVTAPWQVMSDEEYSAYISEPTRLAAKEAWNQKQKGIVPPMARIVITDMVSDLTDEDPLKGYFLFQPALNKVRIPVGTPFICSFKVTDISGSYTLPVSDAFALPITSEGGSTQLIAVSIQNGLASIRISFKESGVYSITEDTINRELPIGSQFAFNNIKLYVLTIPSLS